MNALTGVVAAYWETWRPTLRETLQAYAAGMQRGELVLPFCEPCGRFQLPWLNRCAQHSDTSVRVEPSPATGAVWTWAVYQRQYQLPNDLQVPYVVVAVDMQHGPRLHAVLDLPLPSDQLRRGQAVALARGATAARGYPVFEVVDMVSGG
jgi:uncharacterized OB-fold protein